MKIDNLSLIRDQLLKGDNSCLEEVFTDESDFCIQNLQKSSKCSLEEAEDIFIESVMNFREKIISGQLEQVRNVRNYIYTTCKNMWSTKVKKEISQEKKLGAISNFLYEEYENDPFTVIENREEEKRLLKFSKKSFEQLSEQCQDILHYFYVENYRLNDIAELMQLSSANVVKVMKFRCFKKLTTIAMELFNKETNE